MFQQACLQATVHGVVQGVNFRAFVLRHAQALGLTGYVRNLPFGTVEVMAEGDREQLEQLLRQLEVGPKGARVEQVKPSWSEYTGVYFRFEIRL